MGSSRSSSAEDSSSPQPSHSPSSPPPALQPLLAPCDGAACCALGPRAGRLYWVCACSLAPPADPGSSDPGIHTLPSGCSQAEAGCPSCRRPACRASSRQKCGGSQAALERAAVCAQSLAGTVSGAVQKQQAWGSSFSSPLSLRPPSPPSPSLETAAGKQQSLSTTPGPSASPQAACYPLQWAAA